MRKSKFTDKQIVEILRAIEEGAPVVETLRTKGVSKDYNAPHKPNHLNKFSYSK